MISDYSLTLFIILFLCLDFNSQTMVCVHVELKVHPTLLSCLDVQINVFHQIWEHFSRDFFKYSFCPFSPSYECVSMLEDIPQVPEVLFIFLSLFSLCSLDWIISIELSSSVLILSPGCSHLLLSSSARFFSFQLLQYQFQNFNLILFCAFYILIVLVRHCGHTFLSFFFLHGFFQLSIFIIADLKSFSSKSNILTASGTVSIEFFLTCVWTILSCFFLYLAIFFVVENQIFQVKLCDRSRNQTYSSLEFIVVAIRCCCCSCCCLL